MYHNANAGPFKKKARLTGSANRLIPPQQCSGSVTFWYGSGSSEFGPVPLTNRSGLIRLRILLYSSVTFKTSRKNNFFSLGFTPYSFFKTHLNYSSKKKVIKKSQNNRNQGFSKFFCLLMEGS
jgi:hypothetical protein